MNAIMLASAMGAVLVVAGIVLVAIQLLRIGKGRREPGKRDISAEAGPVKFKVDTTFPGLVMIGLGVILLVVGAIAGR